MLRRAGDPRAAARALSFFKAHERVQAHGVKAVRLRAIERTLFSRVKGRWSVREALTYCRILLPSKFHESKGAGLLLLARFHREFEKDLIDEVESWLSRNYCDNWAAVDSLCPWIITPLIRKHPDLIASVRKWRRSRSLWLRRASVVTFVPFARRGERLDVVYDTAVALFGDREDLIQKAVGWLLREAGVTDPARLEAFLLRHGPRIPRTTLRYAIERFPEVRRRKILVRSR